MSYQPSYNQGQSFNNPSGNQGYQNSGGGYQPRQPQRFQPYGGGGGGGGGRSPANPGIQVGQCQKCGGPVNEKASQSQKNPGRLFRACPNKGCFFEWADQPQQQPQQWQSGQVVQTSLGLVHDPSGGSSSGDNGELLFELFNVVQQLRQQHQEQLELLKLVCSKHFKITNVGGLADDDEPDGR